MIDYADTIDLENAAIPKRQKKAGCIIDVPNSVSQGLFCWLSKEHRDAFWHEHASKEHSINRGLGHIPLNSSFIDSHAHHLHIENNSGFCINVPSWLHKFYPHIKRKPSTLDSINAVALDFLIHEDMYTELFHIKRYP